MNEQVTNSGSMSATSSSIAIAQILTSANDAGGTLNTQVTNSGSMSAISDSIANVQIMSSSNEGTGTMSAAITNSGSMSAQAGSDAAIKLSIDTNEGTGTLNAQITNSGSISAQGDSSGTVQISVGSNEDAGTLNAQITNSGSISAQGDGSGTVQIGTDFNEGTGTISMAITNSGSIFADGSAELIGGTNEGSGSMNVSIVNSGSFVADQAEIDGSNNEGSGTVTNTITVSGSIIGGSGSGNIIGGTNTGGGTTTNTTILSGGGPTISGTIYGDSILPANNGALDQLFFEMQTTNEGQYEQWKSEYDALLAANGGTIPENGQIYWGGKLYTWQGIDEFENLVKFILTVTWFNPNDGRYNGEPAERIAIYCHADKNTLGVLLIDNDSKGNLGTSFDIKKLEALGKGGTSVSFGTMGILSIMMDAQGNGYAAWNGGVDGATGQGDFAKTFACPLP